MGVSSPDLKNRRHVDFCSGKLIFCLTRSSRSPRLIFHPSALTDQVFCILKPDIRHRTRQTTNDTHSLIALNPLIIDSLCDFRNVLTEFISFSQALNDRDVTLQVFTLGCRSNVTVTAAMYKMVSRKLLLIKFN